MLTLPEYTRTDKPHWWYGDKCACCGCLHPSLERDHKLPRRAGGTKEESNIWYICPNCHRLKSNQENREYNGGEKNTFYGKKHSPESVEKMRQKKLGSKHTAETRKLWSDNRKGTDNPAAKLTEAVVIVMRRAYDEGIATCEDLAEHYNVSTRTVWLAVTRRTWKHIGG